MNILILESVKMRSPPQPKALRRLRFPFGPFFLFPFSDILGTVVFSTWLQRPLRGSLVRGSRSTSIHTLFTLSLSHSKNRLGPVLSRSPPFRSLLKRNERLFFICGGPTVATRVVHSRASTFLPNRAESHEGHYWRRMPLTNYINGEIWQSCSPGLRITESVWL